MLNALNYLLNVRAMGIRRPKKLFISEFFFSKQEGNDFGGRNFLLVVLFDFSLGLHSERNVMTGIINVKIHCHLPPVSKF